MIEHLCGTVGGEVFSVFKILFVKRQQVKRKLWFTAGYYNRYWGRAGKTREGSFSDRAIHVE
jgi:hypothetical protein